MEIFSSTGVQIDSLADWEIYCKPASPIHWKSGRSAMETAKAWLYHSPKEFLQLFGSNFTVEKVYPEHKSKFDSYKGNTRNHDLLVIGKSVYDEKIVVSIESKVDEPFGEYLDKEIQEGKNDFTNNPSSNKIKRIDDLIKNIFGTLSDSLQSRIRYQLITAVAGSLAEAKIQAVNKVYFVVQTFIQQNMDSKKHRTNQRDLDFFIEVLSNGRYKIIHNGDMLGPISINWDGQVIELFIGKIDIKI